MKKPRNPTLDLIGITACRTLASVPLPDKKWDELKENYFSKTDERRQKEIRAEIEAIMGERMKEVFEDAPRPSKLKEMAAELKSHVLAVQAAIGKEGDPTFRTAICVKSISKPINLDHVEQSLYPLLFACKRLEKEAAEIPSRGSVTKTDMWETVKKLLAIIKKEDVEKGSMLEKKTRWTYFAELVFSAYDENLSYETIRKNWKNLIP